MNNSDIIAALSLALTAIVFLMQTDDSLLKTKISNRDKFVLFVATLLIIILANFQVLSRFKLIFSYTAFGYYLTPSEWALTIFLIMIFIGLFRLFNPRIFNNNPKVLWEIVHRYRSEKKMDKLHSLLLQIMRLKDFETVYAEQMEDEIFNDHHVIEHFSSNYPDLMTAFAESYPSATMNRGENLYYIWNGLFADKSNAIYSEIRRYRREPYKGIFLNDWEYKQDEFYFVGDMNYETELPIIRWLSKILQSQPSRLKEDTSIFLQQFSSHLKAYNGEIHSEEYITTSLSRDPVFNILQLFRILLIELSYTNKNTRHLMDRVLLIQYSAWDMVKNETTLTEGVQLNNDSYSINEYFLKYIFDTYCLLFILNKRIGYAFSTIVDDNDRSGWTTKQLLSKLDRIVASDRISDSSKKYYMDALLDLYYDLNKYFEGDYLHKCEMSILYELKSSITDSPFGKPAIFKKIFIDLCERKEFYRKNNEHADNKSRSKKMADFLGLTNTDIERKICDK
jgi:hypothetical protein